MNAQHVKNVPAARLIAADVAWVASFASIWTLLIRFWNTAYAIALVPLFALALAGLAEVVHQGVHGNLCGRARFGNRLLGRCACAMFGIDFDIYRGFHFKHHRIVNTHDDPERAFYACPTYVARAASWSALSTAGRLALLPRVIGLFGNSIFSRLGSNSLRVHLLRWGIPLGIAGVGYLEGLRYAIPIKVIVAWYLPIAVFAVIDFLLTQSEHYATESWPQRRSNADQYAISWNLELPAFAEFLVMARNLHAEHHGYPGTHWSIARDKRIGRTLALSDYLRAFWAEGPRWVR